MAEQPESQGIPPQTGEGGEQDSPLDLPPNDVKESLRRAAAEFKSDRGTLTAAGMAFYWFLSVFPAILAFVGVLGLVGARSGAADVISGGVRAALPGDAADVLVEAVQTAGSQPGGSAVVAVLVGLALALWSASAGMAAMQSGLNIAYDIDQDRTFVKKRLVALLLLLATGVLGGLATALVVFGQPIGEAIRDNLPLGGAFVPVWTVARWVMAIGALALLFATFFYLAPNRDAPRWVWVSPGGLVATAIWLAASLAFSFYVSSFGSYAETYGSLTGVVVLLLWLYLSALAVVAGGELNAELERQAAMRTGQVARRGGGDTRASIEVWSQRMRALREQPPAEPARR